MDAWGAATRDFKFGPRAEFEWQHDAHVYPGTPLVTVFDDHCCQITGGQDTYVPASAPSRGLVLRLNQQARIATLVDQYGPRAPDFDALYMGSIEPLRGGDEFVGWGSTPYFSEYAASGKLLLDAKPPGF